MLSCRARPLAAAAALLFVPLAAVADEAVRVRFSAGDPAATPFPNDRFTVRDFTQNTLRRVNLPKPDCAVRPSDCADIDVINTLDGFSTQPRITVPFTGAIDPSSVTSDTIFLIDLGDTLTLAGFGHQVGINQVVWDPATNTLAFESDKLLAQHSRYLLVVTDGVRDADGRRIKPGLGDDEDGDDVGRDIRDAKRLHRGGPNKIAAASLFTTQSISADLQKIVAQIRQSTPAPANFVIGTSASGPTRAVFPASGTNFRLDRQVSTTGAPASSFLPTPALNVVPGSVGRIAYGSFRSPDYETAAKFIPPTGTLTGQPAPQGTNSLVFQLFLPAGAKPAGGWPVVIFGHGFTDSMYGAPWTVASVFASHGLATISINVVGHGGGPLGTLTALPAGVVIPAGGRGIDQDGNGTIDSTEGVSAAPPRTAIGNRDGLRQTVIDNVQLMREIQVGMDVDGDGSIDLDASRIYYAGQSFGGIYGTTFLAVAADLRAGVPNVAGGSIIEVARLGVFRPLTGIGLATRVPSLFNGSPQDQSFTSFVENMPLRNLPPLVNQVPGAMEIAKVLDRLEWVQQAANPVAYAPFIRKQPLPGHAPKPVIFQFAKGDQTVPNPTTTAILRAGDLADRATFYRNDLAFAANNGVPKNPHTFLTNIGNPAAAPFAIGAQQQIAVFLTTGATIDPDGAGPIFEVPVVPPLPETLSFIP